MLAKRRARRFNKSRGGGVFNPDALDPESNHNVSIQLEDINGNSDWVFTPLVYFENDFRDKWEAQYIAVIRKSGQGGGEVILKSKITNFHIYSDIWKILRYTHASGESVVFNFRYSDPLIAYAYKPQKQSTTIRQNGR